MWACVCVPSSNCIRIPSEFTDNTVDEPNAFEKYTFSVFITM